MASQFLKKQIYAAFCCWLCVVTPLPTKQQKWSFSGVDKSDESPTDDAAAADPSEPDETMGDDDEEEEDDGKGPPKLFTISFVNSYGNAQLEQLANDQKPIKFTGWCIVRFLWTTLTTCD